MKLFLDSGAYSAYTRDDPIQIDDYIAYVKENKHIFDIYVNLDVIGDVDKSYSNWVYMRSKGLEPMPVFHIHADMETKYLEAYLDGADYIAIGAIAKLDTERRKKSLDTLWSEWLSDKDGNPIVQTHGFGLTSFDLMDRYPWTSVDSTAWIVQGAAYCHIWYPNLIKGEYVYTEGVNTIDVGRTIKDSHTGNWKISPLETKVPVDYFTSKGFPMGESTRKDVEEGYKLEEGELWASPNKRLVEVIIKEGLINTSRLRAVANLVYIVDYMANTKADNRKYKKDKAHNKRFGLGTVGTYVGTRQKIETDRLIIYAAAAESPSYFPILDDCKYTHRLMTYYELREKSSDFLDEYLRRNSDC